MSAKQLLLRLMLHNEGKQCTCSKAMSTVLHFAATCGCFTQSHLMLVGWTALYMKMQFSCGAEAWQHQVPPLPFELQVLEVVLGDVVALASQLARDLEAVVHPALDSLMKSVSPIPLHHTQVVQGLQLQHYALCFICSRLVGASSLVDTLLSLGASQASSCAVLRYAMRAVLWYAVLCCAVLCPLLWSALLCPSHGCSRCSYNLLCSLTKAPPVALHGPLPSQSLNMQLKMAAAN